MYTCSIYCLVVKYIVTDRLEGGIVMANKQTTEVAPKKLSKRARRNRLIVYIMIIAMLLSSLTAGLAYLL